MEVGVEVRRKRAELRRKRGGSKGCKWGATEVELGSGSEAEVRVEVRWNWGWK